MTIIVPVYNVESYLQRCVESMINQTYRNIEILLIDDCSKDGSLELCNQYAKQDSRISVYQNSSNMGQAYSRQVGLDIAQGDWIMFLDSDDEFDLHAVETMVSFVEKYDVDMVFSSYTVIKSGQIGVCRANIDNGAYKRKDFLSKCLTDVNWNVMCCIGSKIYKKSVLDQYNIKFDPQYKFNEDGAFMLNFLAASKKVGYTDEPFYRYYIRESGSTETSYREDMFNYIKKTNYLLKDLFVENGLFEGNIREFWFAKQRALYLASLQNEVEYKNYSCFKQVFEQIKSDEDFHEVISCNVGSGIMVKLMEISLRYHGSFVLFCVLKLRTYSRNRG